MMGARLLDDKGWSVARLEDNLSVTGCIDCSVDPILRTYHRDKLEHEPLPPHFYATLWFEPVHDLAQAFRRQFRWADFESELELGVAWLCDPLPIIG